MYACRLASDPLLKGVTHVVVDEVHERSLQGDVLMALLQRIAAARNRAADEAGNRLGPKAAGMYHLALFRYSFLSSHDSSAAENSSSMRQSSRASRQQMGVGGPSSTACLCMMQKS